jgi:DedD protein
MALFPLKFPSWRKRDASSTGIGPSSTDSVETLRRRARQRLIGTAILVAAGIVGFPMLFDSQPRPLPVDMRVDMPDRDKVAPLVVAPPASKTPATLAANAPASAPSTSSASGAPSALGAPSAPSAPSAPGAPGAPSASSTAAVQAPTAPAAPVTPAVVAQAETAAAPKPETPAAPKPAAAAATKESPAAAVPPKPEAKPEPKPEAKPEPKPESKPGPKPPPVPPKAEAKAEPKPEPRPAATAAAPPVADADARFIVQIGAFADEARVRDVRARVERAGLKTYIHTIDTPDGKRTRVRVGPYATRADAEKAAERLRSIDLPGAILTL